MHSSALLTLILAFAYQAVESSKVDCLPCVCTNSIYGMQIVCKVDELDALISVFDTLRTNPTKIHTIEIYHYTATELPDGLFDDLDIENVQLSLPKLEYLPSYTFESQKNSLNLLSFSGASLESIPFEAIASLKKLNIFILNENKGFTRIPSTEVSSVETIQALFYYFDGIRTIARNAFANYRMLKRLNIVHNQLTNIDSVILPANFENLYAQFNELTSFPGKMLNSLPAISNVKLHNNKIANFSPEDIKYISKRKYVLWIGANPINCNCSFKNLVIRQYAPPVLGTCQLPSTRSGRSLDSLTVNDFKDC